MKEYKIYGNLEFDVDLEDDHTTLVISVGIDVEKDYRKYMTSLSMYKRRGMTDEEIVFTWDNDDYLYHTLYNNVVCPWVKDNSIIDAQSFADVIKEGIHVKEFAKVKELFDVAISFDFFESLIEK